MNCPSGIDCGRKDRTVSPVRATLKKLRAELHERFAGWLERIAGDRVTEFEEILGFHLEQAYRYREDLGATAPYRGKLHFLTRKRLFEVYPAAERFVEIRREMDPAGVFLNSHLRELFG